MKKNTKLSRLVDKTSLKIKEKSPEILLVTGIVGVVGTVILACRATLKAEEVLEKHEEAMRNIEDAKKISEEIPEKYEYDEVAYSLDKRNQKIKTAVNFVKLYGPSFALGTVSIACILTSRNILNKRYLGAVAAYNAITESFEAYRKRVRDEAGEIMDRHYMYGTELESKKVTVIDEDGNKKKVEQITEKADTLNIELNPDVSVVFDEANPNWDENPEFSKMFLRAQENMATDILRTRGHIFLNEVLDMCGFPQTETGSFIGWDMGRGEGFVSFGLDDIDNENVRRFINGETNVFLLEFNHDGIILGTNLLKK